MPTESTLTLAFLKQFRTTHPAAVAYKINDRTTSGIPDAAITMTGRTLWIEFKRQSPALTPLQQTTMRRLHAATEGRALVVVFQANRRADLYEPLRHGDPGLLILRRDLSWLEAVAYLFGRIQFGDGRFDD